MKLGRSASSYGIFVFLTFTVFLLHYFYFLEFLGSFVRSRVRADGCFAPFTPWHASYHCSHDPAPKPFCRHRSWQASLARQRGISPSQPRCPRTTWWWSASPPARASRRRSRCGSIASFDYNRGRDILFENVVQALTGTHVEAEKVLLYPPVMGLTAGPLFRPAADGRHIAVRDGMLPGRVLSSRGDRADQRRAGHRRPVAVADQRCTCRTINGGPVTIGSRASICWIRPGHGQHLVINALS